MLTVEFLEDVHARGEREGEDVQDDEQDCIATYQLVLHGMQRWSALDMDKP